MKNNLFKEHKMKILYQYNNNDKEKKNNIKCIFISFVQFNKKI